MLRPEQRANFGTTWQDVAISARKAMAAIGRSRLRCMGCRWVSMGPEARQLVISAAGSLHRNGLKRCRKKNLEKQNLRPMIINNYFVYYLYQFAYIHIGKYRRYSHDFIVISDDRGKFPCDLSGKAQQQRLRAQQVKTADSSNGLAFCRSSQIDLIEGRLAFVTGSFL